MAYVGKTIDFRLHYGASTDLIDLSKTLRKRMTPAESVIWQELRRRNIAGYRFRRQHAISNYVVDFFCFEKAIVIEIDGGIHDEPENQEKDANRSAELDRLGLKVIRFKNEEVLNDMETVIKKIHEALYSPSP